MPIFTFSCVRCGATRDELVAAGEPSLPAGCRECGADMEKAFSPTTNLRLAPWFTREAEDANARQKQYMERDDVKAKLKSGELAIDSSDRHSDNYDAPEATSSVVDLARQYHEAK